MQSDTTAYLNTPTLIAPALASFTHRHLKLDADRQAHELHRLASLRAAASSSRSSRSFQSCSCWHHARRTWRSSCRSSRVSSACAARPNLARTARAESSRQPEPITAILDALGALLASPHDAVFAAAGVARGHREAARRSAHPSLPAATAAAGGHPRLEASTAPLAALDCLLGVRRVPAADPLPAALGDQPALGCRVHGARSGARAAAPRCRRRSRRYFCHHHHCRTPSCSRGRRRGSRLRRRAAFDASRRRLAERRRRAAPGEDEARPRPVGATATGRRTDREGTHRAALGTPHRAAQSASPRPAAVEAARHGVRQWQPSETRARQLQLLLQMCTLAPPAAHAALATPHAAALLVAPLRSFSARRRGESTASFATTRSPSAPSSLRRTRDPLRCSRPGYTGSTSARLLPPRRRSCCGLTRWLPSRRAPRGDPCTTSRRGRR